MKGFCEVDGDCKVRLVGEFDLANAGELAEVLATLTGDVMVDCSKLEFFDSSGLNVVLQANRNLEPVGGRVRLVGVSDNLARILELTGLEFLAERASAAGDDPSGELETV